MRNLRIVRELRPRFVIVENVSSGLRRWLGPVLCALRGLGYTADPVAISAGRKPRSTGPDLTGCGAPHWRSRVFVIAELGGWGLADPYSLGGVEGRCVPRTERGGRPEPRGSGGMADPYGAAQGDLRAAARGQERSAGRCGELGVGLADAERVELRVEQQRQPSRRSKRVRDEGGALARDTGEAVGDAERKGRSRTESAPRSGARAEPPESARDRDAIGLKSLVGRAAPGLPGRMARRGLHAGAQGIEEAFAGLRWPAGKGAAQEDWEAPRIAEVAPRSHASKLRAYGLRALGNAVVPACARVVGHLIATRLLPTETEERTTDRRANGDPQKGNAPENLTPRRRAED